MGNSIHLQQKSKLRHNQTKIRQEKITITGAKYLQNFFIAVTFSTGETKMIDFLPLFHQHVKGDYLKYFSPSSFKKFIINNNNLYWGKNEDVIFPVSLLLGLKQSKDTKEEILYVI